jgi:hypothetical protein
VRGGRGREKSSFGLTGCLYCFFLFSFLSFVSDQLEWTYTPGTGAVAVCPLLKVVGLAWLVGLYQEVGRMGYTELGWGVRVGGRDCGWKFVSLSERALGKRCHLPLLYLPKPAWR